MTAKVFISEQKCRICGRGLTTNIPYWPDPLLPGDLPTNDELCSECQERAAAGVSTQGSNP